MKITPPYRHIRRNRYLDIQFGLVLDLGCDRGGSVCREGYTFRSRNRLLVKGYDTTRGQAKGETADYCGRPVTSVHPWVSYRLIYIRICRPGISKSSARTSPGRSLQGGLGYFSSSAGSFNHFASYLARYSTTAWRQPLRTGGCAQPSQGGKHNETGSCTIEADEKIRLLLLHACCCCCCCFHAFLLACSSVSDFRLAGVQLGGSLS